MHRAIGKLIKTKMKINNNFSNSFQIKKFREKHSIFIVVFGKWAVNMAKEYKKCNIFSNKKLNSFN